MRISTGRAPRHKSARCVLRVECSYYHISVNDQCMSQARGLRAAAAPGGQPPPNLSLHGERRPVTLAETTVERGLWRGSLLSCSFIKALRFGEILGFGCHAELRGLSLQHMPARFGGAAAHFCRRHGSEKWPTTCVPRARCDPRPAFQRWREERLRLQKRAASRAAAALYEP